MLKDKAGNRLFRKMTVKVIFPEAIFPDRTYVQHAGPKQGFGPEGVNEMLMAIADQLETLYPFWEFSYSELTPVGRTGRFVFKFAGYRATPVPEKPIADSTTPEPGTPESPNTTEAIKTFVGTTLQELASSERVQQ
jgi:hypothetical protein